MTIGNQFEEPRERRPALRSSPEFAHERLSEIRDSPGRLEAGDKSRGGIMVENIGGRA